LNSSSPRRWLLRAAALLLLVAVLVAVHVYNTRGVPRGPAPDFHALRLDGTPVALDDYRGAPLLLQFWATWCPVCRLEQGAIDAIARDHAVLSIALDEADAAAIRAYMKAQGVDYPVVHDPQARIAALYGIRGVPTSIVLDGKGEIRFVEVGYTTGPGLRLRLWWAGRQ